MIHTLFVVEDPSIFAGTAIQAIGFDSYLHDYPKRNEPRTRVINLCDTFRYLSQGYYCSLLAEARNHQVVPSVKTINELRGDAVQVLVSSGLFAKGTRICELPESILVCMGDVADARLQKLAHWIYQRFAAPVLSLTLKESEMGIHVAVKRAALNTLSVDARELCLQTLENYSQKSWRSKADEKKYRWELALLTNANEQVPPSNKGAIARFIKAGEKHGIRTKLITEADYSSLSQYDALFIRETTAIDHHTYRFAREAERLGLVVMDDPDSILRCCNKVFLHDAFSYKKVPSLHTVIVSDIGGESVDCLEQSLSYPMILKMPEGSFSKGVFKVKDRDQLLKVGQDLLNESALMIAQEYLFTDYDWRIGVLNGRALYACRYYMAKNHWQIYNHGSQRNFSGGFDALPTFEVPTHVLKAAMKAAEVVGDGLYGIDIKEVGGKAFVLEVNDNPSIEHGVEDKYLGEELYMQVMAEFLRRLEARGR
ncbi:RimK family protein [Gilvimarinus sp. SDUM040013]|uniref:RimK family protein n=1 Tax=Gilvimarinus gilvus TaxID=3058038 RepID=A0ABU4S1B2_9GAMM|nr:RimK family protein [Gilvimarinus sp. SDUM040013]MDO3388071.1 RimK family protein [Gilvimarinus sp. SDUM040013]MDX6850979.1 RimK family protein [Gilvimarinus sp. SDUM040013]